MTNEKWQEVFQLMKLITKPSNKKSITTCNNKMVSNLYINDTYYGDTMHQLRVKLLNDNLKQIREGKRDYVYFIYNISELLKYEHEQLRSHYNQDEQYFEVWLEAKQ